MLNRAFEFNFGRPADKVFHFNPTDWKSRPDFVLEEILPDNAELKNIDPVQLIAYNRLNEKGSISDRPYKTTISGYYQSNEETGFDFETLSVKEAILTYETGNSSTLGLGPNDEKQASEKAAKTLKDLFIAPTV